MREVVGSRRLELRTSCVSSRRSNQLSYEPVLGFDLSSNVQSFLLNR